MNSSAHLTAALTIDQFRCRYWYTADLKAFARRIGIPSVGQWRKNELERAVLHFFRTGRVAQGPPVRPVRHGVRDVERSLRLGLRVTAYVNNPETWAFREREARAMAPDFTRKSAAPYRLNRWREAQRATRPHGITYRDLVREYVRLCGTAGPFRQVAHGRYINFVSDFMAKEPNATRAKAVAAWLDVKALDAPKKDRARKQLER
ncbi:MAG: SAP domain-containing protein [Gemmatimonadales bacterium]|nr:SAP domain-containing protein [Gemmatimonadales bacterium]